MNRHKMKERTAAGKAVSAILPPVVLIALLLGFWQVACVAKGIQSWMLPKPLEIFSAMGSTFGENLPYLLNTCGNILLGFALSVVIGLALAVLLTSSKLLSSALTPIIVVLCCVPMVTLVPLLLVVLGTGSLPKVLTIIIQCFALVNMNACVGFMNVDPARLELMQSLKATRYEQFRYCILRNAMPSIFTGIKLASVLAMVSGVGAEMSGGQGGLGNRISYLVGYSRTAEAFSCILYIAIFGLLLYFLISALEKKLNKGM